MAREKWSSNIGFILASIGSAVGLGNIWRFPYIVGTNGGGAFLIPYLIAVILFALPIIILEFAVGRHYKTSIIETFTGIRKKFKIAGMFMVFAMLMILSYYLVITGWVLAYTLFFILGMSVPFSDFTGSYQPILFFLISGAMVFYVVRAGVIKGIEKLCTILLPLLLAMILMLVAFALTLPGAKQGLQFYLTPDFSKMLAPSVWRAAFGQAFYSLGAGTGIMLTYGSYMRNEKIVKSATIIAISDLTIALLVGFIIFPFVFTFGLDPAAGVQLAFITLPTIFETMNYGFILGAAFFTLLFFAALTSAVSIMEVPVAALMDSYEFTRKKAATFTFVIVMLLGLPSALSYTTLKLQIFEMPFFDLIDITFGTIGIVVTGLILTIIVVWFVDQKIILKEIGGKKEAQKLFMLIIKIFVPLMLLISLVLQVIELV